MPISFSQKKWAYGGMLVLSLALGIAIAAALNAWSESEEISAAGLLADAAAALVIAAVMVVFGRLTGLHPFEKAVTPVPGPPGTLK